MEESNLSNIESTRRWTVLENPEAVAEMACKRILAAAVSAIASSGRFKLVLAGGSTPEAVYKRLSKSHADWRCWDFYFGDERCLPADDAERNSVKAVSAWLSHIDIKASQIKVMPAEMGAEVAAQRYDAVIAPVLPFDLVLLGVGEDGHTASLFPGHEHKQAERVHAVYQSPKPPLERVSLSSLSLSCTSQVLVLATGEGKAEAIRLWREGHNVPVSTITAIDRFEVLLDAAAACRSDLNLLPGENGEGKQSC